MSKPDLFRNGRNPYALAGLIPGARDRRIDILRGVAVLGISANHIWLEGTVRTQLPEYKFGHLFAFDFADVFVLLSGIVAGLVFFPVLMRHGPRRCGHKALKRAGQIWGAQILCTLAALTIILAFETQLGVTGTRLSPFDGSVLVGFAGNVLLYNPSVFLDILPVYIMLLLALTPALMLFKRSAIGYFALIGSVWALIWAPAFLIGAGQLPFAPDTFRTPYFMHPLSAQLLFFTGVALGIRKREIESFLTRYKSRVLTGALFFLLASNYMHQVDWMVHHFDQKHVAGPLRLADLLAVLMVIWCLVSSRSFQTPKPGLVETCGRQILPVFAITSVGAVFLTYTLTWLEAGRGVYGLCILTNVGLCLISAYLLEKRRTATSSQQHKRPPQPTASVLEPQTV